MLLLSIVPLHLVLLVHPLLALFVVPIVAVGQNLQYHRIVWAFGRSKYLEAREPRWRCRASFQFVSAYLFLDIAFTFLFYQGPWVELVKSTLGGAIDRWLVEGVGMVAGISSPEEPGIGGNIAATPFMGWAMQHDYHDSKIWRVRRDPGVEVHLRSRDSSP